MRTDKNKFYQIRRALHQWKWVHTGKKRFWPIIMNKKVFIKRRDPRSYFIFIGELRGVLFSSIVFEFISTILGGFFYKNILSVKKAKNANQTIFILYVRKIVAFVVSCSLSLVLLVGFCFKCVFVLTQNCPDNLKYNTTKS